MSELINHLELYRLPWNLADNGVSWLEPTAQCNLACDGCYRNNRVEHKSMAETTRELDVFDRHRRSDSLSIAGGDPLLYPNLVETVTEAKRRGYKPVVNTNGLALTTELLRDLKRAGLAGFTFHVDSKQGRPGKWRGKNELELCELRDELAEKARSIGVSCAFNATVYPDTLDDVVPLTQWAADRIDRVHVMVFILYRDMVTSGFRYFNGEEEIKIPGLNTAQPRERGKKRKKDEPVYNLDVDKDYTAYVKAEDIVSTLRSAYPDFQPSAYLNGTQDPKSFKWLLAGRVGRPGRIYGYVGPKFMELAQTAHHLFTNRYLAYASPRVCRQGRRLLLLSAVDKGVRTAARGVLRDWVRSPLTALTKPLHFQTVLIIQPIDIMADGRMNMCDGCPDMTVWKDELVWSCRMDEQERFGRNLWAKPLDPTLSPRAAEPAVHQ